MQNNDFRAKQFLPFDALNGFYESIRFMEKLSETKKDLFEEEISDLNEKLKKINKNSKVTIKYYNNLNYIETTDIIKKIDIINKCIYTSNSKVYFDDILDIDII